MSVPEVHRAFIEQVVEVDDAAMENTLKKAKRSEHAARPLTQRFVKDTSSRSALSPARPAPVLMISST